MTVNFDRVPDAVVATLEARRPLRMWRTDRTLEFSIREDEASVLTLLSEFCHFGKVRRIELGRPALEDIAVALMERQAVN